ncbi:MAG: energy-coupling factor ABC transporter permease [Bacillota bacterium]
MDLAQRRIAMHIPDGFLDPKTWIGASAISAAALAGALAMRRKEGQAERQIPVMGMLAAFIFVAQLINFPLVGGTTAHLSGGALAAILLGPATAIIVMTTVVAVQCLFFLGGGVTALGANILNMAVVAPLVAYGTYRGITMLVRGRAGRTAGVFLAAWLSVVMAAVVAAGQLALSGTVQLKVVMPAMTGWYAVIGVVEGLITVVVVSFVQAMGMGTGRRM